MKKKEEQGGVSILDLDRRPSWEGQIVRARPVFTCWKSSAAIATAVPR